MNEFTVFDLETQRSAQDVGGWNNIAEMKMAVGVVWDSLSGKYCTYLEDQVIDLMDHLLNSPLVIGFNHIGFDYIVLSGYFSNKGERSQKLNELKEHNNLDILLELKKKIGKRVKLDSIARSTLKIGKSADGLLALKWYKEFLQGEEDKMQMIIDYCRQDVTVTRDIYLYGAKNGGIFYEDKSQGITRVTVDWGNTNLSNRSDDSVQLSF